MKFLCFAFLIAHGSIVASHSVGTEESNTWNISLADFHDVVTSGNALVVDVREYHEVADVHVKAKAYVNIPLKQLKDAMTMDKDIYSKKYKSNKPDTRDPLVFICRSGRRSDTAIRIARDQNYQNTRHYNKGHIGWIANYPDLVVRNASNPWNISLVDFHSVVTGGKALVVDVREPHEVAEIYVDAKKYVNIPLKKLGDALKMDSNQYEEKYMSEKPSDADQIVFICRSGRRSDTAIRIARENQFFNTRHYNKGTLGWVKNYPEVTVRGGGPKEEL